jgi:hypothetical protein
VSDPGSDIVNDRDVVGRDLAAVAAANGQPDVTANDEFAIPVEQAVEVPSEVQRAPRIFPGLTYVEMLAAEVDLSRELVADLIEVATVGTIASVPELGKSHLAFEIAHKVAAGGKVLDHFEVRRTGPVGYWWQDDSRANELARAQAYAERHGYATSPPGVRFHLNEGLRLPEDLTAIRAEVEAEGQVLAVLDSFYNFTGGLGSLKDEDAALVFAAMKSDLCDPTGVAVLVVDHSPWPNESNRGQRRAYGSVFKGAAIRWGIYLEPHGRKTYIEARGNNVRGFKRTPCYFDADALEIRFVDVASTDHEEIVDERVETVREWLRSHPGGHSTTAVRDGVEGRATVTDEALEALKARDEVRDEDKGGGTWSGRAGTPRYWKLSGDAGLTPSGESAGEVGRGSTQTPLEGTPSRPLKRDEVPAGRGSDEHEEGELGWR